MKTESPRIIQLDSNSEIPLTIELSNKLLRTIETGSPNSRSVVNFLNAKLNHFQFLNAKLNHFQLSPSSRLEERLKNEISRTGSAYKKCKCGRNKLQFDKKVKKISVTSAEIVNVQGLKPQSDLTDLHSGSIPTMNAPESPGSFEISITVV